MNSSLRVATFNICLTPQFTCRRRRFAEMRVVAFLRDGFGGHWPDVLFLQEVWDTPLRKWSRVLELGLAAKGYKVIVKDSRTFWQPTNSGLMIASRFPVALDIFGAPKITSQKFTHSAGFQKVVPRGILCLTVLHPHIGPLALVNTHIHATTEDSRWCNSASTSRRTQERQILQVLKFVADLPGTPAVVVAGDFNVDRLSSSSSCSFSFDRLNCMLGTPPVNLYTSRAATTHTYPHPKNGNSPLVDPTFRNRECYLDHIFANFGNMDTQEVWIPRAHHHSSPPVWISDHAAVLADIHIHNTPTPLRM